MKGIDAPLHGILRSPIPMLGFPPFLSAASMFAFAFKSNFIDADCFLIAAQQSGVWPPLRADSEFACRSNHRKEVGEGGRS